MTGNATDRKTSRIAGVMLIGLSAISLLFMAHHPTLGTPGYDTLAREAVAEAGLNGVVHGALILVTIGFYVALGVLSDALGRDRISVRAAETTVAIATATMVGAALVSGFIVPETAGSLLRADAAAAFPEMLHMLGAVNQTLAKTGTVAYGAAIFFWSLRLAASSGFSRIAGAAGLVIGGGLAVGILTGVLRLDVAGMTLALAVMGAWFVLSAAVMISGALAPHKEQ